MAYLPYILLFAFFICVFQGTTVANSDSSMPIAPTDYQQYIKQGFSTNYFKRHPAASTYQIQNIQDIKDKGFRNLRLPCRADLYNNYREPDFEYFLTKLTEVVDECINKGVAPIISWIHHEAEANATEQERLNYLEWWRRVAEKLKDKSYLLSFNLFTELGVDRCMRPGCSASQLCCSQSLRVNKTKYHQWTRQVISTIRATGSNNAQRILILGSPDKTSVGLDTLRTMTYLDSSNQMVEWHEYAAGPSSIRDHPHYWSGNGTDQQKSRLRASVEDGSNFTIATGIPTYFGAWTPRDKKNGGLNETEVMSFAKFFVSLLKDARIPWSLNELNEYYDTQRIYNWKTDIQNLAGASLNMSRVLDTIISVM